MGDVHAELRAYYEAEAAQRSRGPLRGRRVELRDECLELMRAEDRSSVVDFGAGPGRDVAAFVEAGHRCVGVDLAHGNGVLAAESSLTVVQGSIAAPPLKSASFDTGWSMSTLMHIPEPEVPPVLAAMAGPLCSGAPFFIGLWGALPDAEPVEHFDEGHVEGQRRLFSLRSAERNRELIGALGEIEREACWNIAEDGSGYQVFVVRLS